MGLQFGQTFTIICAALSIAMSLAVLVSYTCIDHWRNDMKHVKILLVAVSVAVLFEAFAALDVKSEKTNLECALQALSIEVCCFIHAVVFN
jgi:hypothetical protein